MGLDTGRELKMGDCKLWKGKNGGGGGITR